MSARRLVMLLIAAILVIAAALWVSSQRHLERATAAGDRVLPGLEKALNDVNEIRLAKGDGAHTTLKKRASDWIVAERGYPADSGRVRKLLLDLGALAVIEEKTRNPANYALIGVEEVNSPKAAGTRAEAVTPRKTFAVIVGKSAGMKSGYVRVVGAEQSLLAEPQITPDADPKRWIDRGVIDVADRRVKEIVVETATGLPYTATRASPQQLDYTVPNLPKGRELSSPAAADSLGSAIASVEADDVRRPPAPAAGAAKADHAIFRTFDGLTLDVTGSQDGEHRYIALAASSTAKESQAEADGINTRLKGWQIEVPSYKYDSIFKPLEDLLKKVEPPKAKVNAKTQAQKPKEPALDTAK